MIIAEGNQYEDVTFYLTHEFSRNTLPERHVQACLKDGVTCIPLDIYNALDTFLGRMRALYPEERKVIDAWGERVRKSWNES